jgi:hypothetical protein
VSDPFLTVEWGPVVNAGFPLGEAASLPHPFLTVGWEPKLGTSHYPYETAE